MFRALVLSLVVVTAAAACGGGTRLLVQPENVSYARVIGHHDDGHAHVIVLGLIAPDGPGHWSRGAEWDEYLVRVSGDPGTRVLAAVLIDANGVVIEPLHDRASLIAATYRRSGRPSLLPRRDAPVDEEIQRRATAFPADTPTTVHAFFPVTPWPARLGIAYEDGRGVRRTIMVDVRNAVSGLRERH